MVSMTPLRSLNVYWFAPDSLQATYHISGMQHEYRLAYFSIFWFAAYITSSAMVPLASPFQKRMLYIS
jgi:hypothetical protein